MNELAHAARDAALRAALRGDPDSSGMCLRAVRSWLGVPAGARTAREAWEATPAPRRHTGPAPVGAPLFFAVGTNWHVALVVGPGVLVSTDLPEKGLVGLISPGQVARRWNAKRLGWTDLLNGVDLRPILF